ncbi:MAG: hypothetical protein ACI37S_07395 [Candidatus Gastranaerophilaceae bacterium]
MITSDIIKIPNTENITTEYIENELRKRHFNNILRWALVHTNRENLTISVAYEK